MKIPFVALTTAVILAACVPQNSAMNGNRAETASLAQPSPSILWARTDGRRMSTDPVLYQQGAEDKARCEEEATAAGVLDFRQFSACMNRSGYVQMR